MTDPTAPSAITAAADAAATVVARTTWETPELIDLGCLGEVLAGGAQPPNDGSHSPSHAAS